MPTSLEQQINHCPLRLSFSTSQKLFIYAKKFTRVGLLGLSHAVFACKPAPRVAPPSADTPQIPVSQQAFKIYEQLESLIREGKDTRLDRKLAYDRIRRLADDQSTDYAFARAAVAGRLAEARGITAGRLVTEVETYALRVLAKDADYRRGEAKRMLATLYILAPVRYLEHGDSEKGIEILEQEIEDHPERIENHLRLAQGFISLHDPEAAIPYLCTSIRHKDQLQAMDQRLLQSLLAELGSSLTCESSPS